MNHQRKKLPNNLTIRAISDVRQDLLRDINKSDSLAIELPANAQLDLSFLQVMESARIYSKRLGKPLTIDPPVDGVLLDALRRAGWLTDLSEEARAFWLQPEVIQ